MAVTLLITEQEQVGSLVAWGAQFARARHLQLVALVPRKNLAEPADLDLAKPPADDGLLQRVAEALALVKEKYAESTVIVGDEQEKRPPFEPSCRLLPGKDAFATVVSELRAQKAKLLIIGKHRKLAGNEPTGQLVHELFRRAPCDTLLLRPNNGDDVEPRRIVVPAAGGPHAPVAIAWAADLALENDAVCVPLYVEPEIGGEAEAVGIYHLNRVLDQAKIERTNWIQPRVIVASSPAKGMQTAAKEGCELIMIGASEKGTVRRMLFGTLPQKLLQEGDGVAVGVMRRGKALFPRMRDRVEDWLDMRIPQLERDERIALFDRLQTGSRWNFDFLALMSLATIIAALGLLQNSAAVVIGAMLVAPLMTPLIAMGLALIQSNWVLLRQASRAVGYGFLLAVGLGLLTGLVHPVGEITAELASRGRPNVFDLAIALFSGIAAAYALARPNLSAALPGVAIAAALVPPLATIGISLAFGSYDVALGSTMLFASNLTAIILGSAFVFHACGVQRAVEHSRGEVWAQRLIMSLLVASFALTIPLGSRVIKRAGEYRRHRLLSTYVKNDLGTVFAEHRLAVSHLRILPGTTPLTVEIAVDGAAPPPLDVVATARELCSKQLEQPVKLRIVTRLVSESSPAD